MTCIVGIAEHGIVTIGGDSAAASGWTYRLINHPKVFSRGELVIGYTSSFRMGQLLQYALVIPEHKDTQSDMSYMVAGVTEAIRDLFKSHGFATVNNNEESGGEFLIGYRGALYHVNSDFSVLCYRDRYDAVGCGAPFALGALAAMGSDLSPKKRIKRALNIAAQFSNGVYPPSHVVSGAAARQKEASK